MVGGVSFSPSHLISQLIPSEKTASSHLVTFLCVNFRKKFPCQLEMDERALQDPKTCT